MPPGQVLRDLRLVTVKVARGDLLRRRNLLSGTSCIVDSLLPEVCSQVAVLHSAVAEHAISTRNSCSRLTALRARRSMARLWWRWSRTGWCCGSRSSGGGDPGWRDSDGGGGARARSCPSTTCDKCHSRNCFYSGRALVPSLPPSLPPRTCGGLKMRLSSPIKKLVLCGGGKNEGEGLRTCTSSSSSSSSSSAVTIGCVSLRTSNIGCELRMNT